MSEISMFTIVIPTKDRHPFLYRTLIHLAEEKCPYQIIIGDCSKFDFDCEKFENVCYFNFSEDVNICERIIECLKKVTTPYVLMLGDDDFINLSMIPKICNFMDHNKDYVAVDGREIRVRCNEQGIKENIFHSQSILNNNDCIERISAHCKSYWPTFYAIHRTSVLLNSFKVMEEIESLGYLFQELTASIATILQGKYYTFSEIYLIRQNFHSQSTQTVWWSDLVKSSTFNKNNHIMIDALVDFGKKLSILPTSFDGKKLEKAIDKFYAHFRYQNKVYLLKAYIRKLFPIPFRAIIKKVCHKFYPMLRNKPTTMDDLYIDTEFYKKVKEILSIYPFGRHK
jgi:glycosyltransferase domain-containing protein